MAENMMQGGSHSLTFTIAVRNLRSVPTNVSSLKFDGLKLRPMLFIFGSDVTAVQEGKVHGPSDIILKRGIWVELIVSASTKFPEDFKVTDDLQIDWSSLEALLTDGFGGTHSISAKTGLKLFVVEEP